MHPAPSVIIFTTISGLGFGLFAWLGLATPDVYGMSAFIWFFIAYALSVGGLISSTFHLGNKMNAIYAFSQWKTSWLSREGVMAVITLLLFAPYAIARIFFETTIPALGIIGAITALITVFTTSMIYGQLKTIPRWYMPTTPALFMLYAIAGGTLISGQARLAGLLLVLLLALQILAWAAGDKRLASLGSDKGTATGLGGIGKVRMMESAHTTRNYILDEMVHQVGRKHAQKLRIIATLLIGVFPILLLILPEPSHFSSLVALLSHVAGVAVSRWLFFAEAEHVVGLYYSHG
jgi:DMSO reductase anchor subunit